MMNKLHIPSKIKSNKKALVCYIPESYTYPSDHPNFFGHSNFQESKALLESLVENGFSCDVLNWNEDARSLAGSNYDIFIGIHHQLEYAKTLVKEGGKVILYSTGCHWPFHNLAEYDRLNQLRMRRGIVLLPRRQTPPNLLEGQVDEIWYFGNDFQKNTYAHFQVPKHRINISTIAIPQLPDLSITETKKKNFLWFGSAGAVHKGLDWLLEIFSKNPELHLHVCGLVELEKDFAAAFHQELYKLPNIHFHGWVLPNTEKYLQITKECGFIVSPSCTEGGGGATLQCMSVGLVPLLSKANGIDTHDFGFTVKEDRLEEIENLIIAASKLPTAGLEERSKSAQKFIQENHTLKHYKASVVNRIKELN